MQYKFLVFFLDQLAGKLSVCSDRKEASYEVVAPVEDIHPLLQQKFEDYKNFTYEDWLKEFKNKSVPLNRVNRTRYLPDGLNPFEEHKLLGRILQTAVSYEFYE